MCTIFNQRFLNCAGFFPKPDYVFKDDNPEVLRLAFYAYGGMGDTLIATALIKAVRKLVKLPLQIDYYCNYPEVYKGFPFIDNALKLTQFSDSCDYDFSAFVFRNIYFRKINMNKVKLFSEVLYNWCIDAININEKICDNFRDDCRYSEYAARKGCNRIEQHNINGILPYDRYTPVYMELDLNSYRMLEEFGLAGKQYITISSGIENCNTMRNPKLWDIGKYNSLVNGNVYNIPAEDNKYDTIVHFLFADNTYGCYALKELLRVVKPLGRLIIYGGNDADLSGALSKNNIDTHLLSKYSDEILLEIQKY